MPKSHKIDRNIIFHYLGNNQAAINFANALENILSFEKLALSFLKNLYAPDTTPQHARLIETLENCNNLLTILQPPLKRSEGQLQLGEEFLTAWQIQNSLRYINREKEVEQDADIYNNVGTHSAWLSDARKAIDKTKNRLAGMLQPQPDKNIINELDAHEISPEDYPDATIKSIEKLRDAVVHAIDKTKPKPGKKTYRTSHYLRKDKLGREFVQAYLMCYGMLPAESIDSPVYNVFVEFLYAADLSGQGEEHCYKKSIKNIKSGLERTKKMGRSVQSGTKKDKA